MPVDETERSVEKRDASRWRRARRLLLNPFTITLAILVTIRLMLPSLLQRYVTDVLSQPDKTQIRMTDLDINFWRGAYEIEGLEIYEAGDPRALPVLQAAKLDLAIDFSSILSGQLIGQAVLHRPIVHIEKERRSEGEPDFDPEEQREQWWDALQSLLPVSIERMNVLDGRFEYVDNSADPKLDLFVEDVYVDASVLTNRADLAEERPSRIEAAGRPFGDGELVLEVDFSPFADPAEFVLRGEAREIALVSLNDFLVSAFDADAEAGVANIAVFVDADDGNVDGFVKMVFEGVEMVRVGEIDNPAEALQFAWEAIVGLGAEILENQPYDRLAFRVPLSGRLDDPKTDTWGTITSLLTNAYLDAIRPGLREETEADPEPEEGAPTEEAN